MKGVERLLCSRFFSANGGQRGGRAQGGRAGVEEERGLNNGEREMGRETKRIDG